MDDNPQPYGSWGNGAAMRISPVGLLATSEDDVIGWADAATAITHNHPKGITSARAVALAIFWARHKTPAQDIKTQLTERFGYDLSTTPDDIRPTYTRTERAAGSVPQAIICALQSTSYEDAIRSAVSIGGDSDTIAAIAGGIAEALHGIPNTIAIKAWAFLPNEMQKVIAKLYQEGDTQKLNAKPKVIHSSGVSDFSQPCQSQLERLADGAS
jgi:ADP-ribosylglycohydrolase